MAEETGARCGECRKPMQRRRRWQRFCSTVCRMRAYWRGQLNADSHVASTGDSSDASRRLTVAPDTPERATP